MNGLEPIAVNRPPLFRRLIGKGALDLCAQEIHNLLAGSPGRHIGRDQVDALLVRHGVTSADLRPHLTGFYRTALAHFAADHELTAAEGDDLDSIRIALRLSDDDAASCQRDILQETYRRVLAEAVSDGFLDSRERQSLDAIVANFRLPEERVKALYAEEATRALTAKVTAFLSDGRLTDIEEDKLGHMAASLGVNLKYDGDTQRIVTRARLLAQIERGALPALSTGLSLPKGEACHAQLTSRHCEFRTQTKAIRYSGPTASIRIMKGLRWRMGQVSVQRVTQESLVTLDTGTLYITNRRLLFDGSRKNASIPLKKVLGFTVFADGLRVEKDTGKDQYFLGAGDMEVVGAILDAALAA